MKGRKPKATAIKQRNGSYRVNPGRRNKQEPKPKAERPKMPTNLHGDKLAQRVWHKTCDLLDEMGILTVAEVYLVELFALTYSKYIAAHRIWTKEGFFVEGRRHPIATDYHKLADRIDKLIGKMGLEPAERSRLKSAVESEEDDILMQFLNDGLN